ncbi:hypothetical protein EEK90_02750 [Muribaculaceae bacterium Isolate-036 (Harlan)]|nr:hypothetical protein EEK90_02750 [Muribaculaceae bacterium Isolate-036 (Harlan)]
MIFALSFLITIMVVNPAFREGWDIRPAQNVKCAAVIIMPFFTIKVKYVIIFRAAAPAKRYKHTDTGFG